MANPWLILLLLFLINTANFYDRLIISAIGEPIRKEFDLSDTSLGLLSTAFVLLYAFVGVPVGRFADKYSRKRILSIGVFVWSFLTLISGFARSFGQLFFFRLGVGVGEATCAPAATSLISDIFPVEKRARAMSIFMLGLPVGIALSFLVSGAISAEYGWRYAFFVAGIPGIFLSILILLIREPERPALARDERTRLAFWQSISNVFRPVTMRWLVISGVIHNFCLYALSAFMTPYLMRFHGLDIREATLVAMLVNGIFTLPGLLLGGFAGDAARKWRSSGGLLVVAVASLLSAPLFIAAVLSEKGNTVVFLWTMGLAFALMYFYYSITYAAIADITPPENRATAMAVYFFAMYFLGGALGPYVVGMLSDYFTRRAAMLQGIVADSSAALEPFRGYGLQDAMLVVPVLCVILSGIMFMAARAMKPVDSSSA